MGASGLSVGSVLVGVIVLADWFWGWQGSFTVGNWWAGLICLLLAIGSFFLMHVVKPKTDQEKTGWFFMLLRPVGGVVAVVFRLDWFYQLIAFLYRLVRGIVRFLTVLLEGEGGVLWALLLLTLLLSVLYAGSLP